MFLKKLLLNNLQISSTESLGRHYFTYRSINQKIYFKNVSEMFFWDFQKVFFVYKIFIFKFETGLFEANNVKKYVNRRVIKTGRTGREGFRCERGSRKKNAEY